MHRLQQDDKDILWEGVDALTDTECRAALRARGIPFTGLSPEQMRSGLSEWVQVRRAPPHSSSTSAFTSTTTTTTHHLTSFRLHLHLRPSVSSR